MMLRWVLRGCAVSCAVLACTLMMVRYAPARPATATAHPLLQLAVNATPASPALRVPPASFDSATAWPAPSLLGQRMRLVGTMVGNPPLALMERRETGAVTRYRIGDHVENATLKEIHRGSVRLTDAGQDVVLFMEDGAAGADVGPPAAPRPENAVEATTVPAVQLTPRFTAGGVFEGMELQRLQPAQLAQRVGLEPGDVIQTVNGQRLATVEQTLQVLKKAWQGPAVQLQLRRGNTPLSRTVVPPSARNSR